VTELELLQILYRAARTPVGLVVSTSSPEFLRQKLYPLRKTEPAFANLSFVISPIFPATELWILNKPEKETDDVL